MLLTIVALLEFNGRRRPWVIGLALGLAALARPTVAIAVVPVGLAVVLGSDRRVRSAIGLAIPLVAVAGVIGWYDWARFGSPFDTGYATTKLPNRLLVRWRHQGLFSIHHVPTNLKTLVAGGFSISRSFPFVIPNPYGHSMLLTSPALLLAVRAGFRNRTAAVLWISAALITIALLLYYGGAGYQTYGYRYFLDAVPFLLALVAMAAERHFGAARTVPDRPERPVLHVRRLLGAYNGHF